MTVGAGYMVGATASVAATNGTYDIKPSSGEWVIHNLYYAGAVQFSMTDGTNTIQFDSDTGAGARLGMTTHVSNTYWLRISNTGASAVLVAYDGMQTA